MGSLFSKPSTPDPYATANAQAAANAEAVRESAKVNAVDQITPYGSVTYNRNADGTPNQQIVNLTPEQQQVLDQQNQLALMLSGAANNQAQFIPTEQFSLAQFGNSPSATDYGAQAQQVEQAVFDRSMGLLRPEFEAQNRQLEQTISNRGLPTTGEAAQIMQDSAYRRQSEAMQNAALDAVRARGTEQNRLFGLEMQGRQQGINEYNMERQAPFNELAAFLQGTPVFGQQATPMAQYQIAPADVAGNIYQNYNTQMGSYNNAWGALGQGASALGGAAIMASDRRLKDNIEKIGETPSLGLNVYSYKYKGSDIPQVGVMADEVLGVCPDAVIMMSSGYYAVDYGKIS